ncbi:MAG: restriction endonuclease subunit S [Clostridia bacterium]|nr:restriction endonuclease subunit S [Clostridia bacterium]
MARVRLGDVAREYKETIKDSSSLPVVGLEHLTPGEISLEHWDEGVENTFSKGFKKGHMLFGRRRAYLRKAALAPFDGVCSGDITVIEAIPEKMDPELLPFIIQNDLLFDYAVGNSAGSLSPRVKWESLQNYEFELPERTKQAEMVELLKAAHETRRSYKALIQATDDLVKSQFIEMFGSPVSLDKGWQVKTIGDVATTQLGKMLNAKNQTGQDPHYYLANRNVQWFRIDPTDLRTMDFDESERKKYALENGDLLVCEGGEIGRCAVWHGEISDCYMQNAVHRVRCDLKQITPVFLGYQLFYHAEENGFSDIVGSKATIAHLPADKLKAMRVLVPPIEKQHTFEALAEQSDKSKFELEQAIQKVDNLIKSLISQE